MFADTEDELHEFGRKIGMKRSWFQPDPRLPHYDINTNRRRIAVAAGAIEVDFKFVCRRMRRNAKARNSKRPSKAAR